MRESLLWIPASVALPDPLAWGVVALTAAILALLVPLAVHRLILLAQATRGARPGRPGPRAALHHPGPSPDETPFTPRVTVQLPLFNEAEVAARLLRAVAALDYPRDRLEVQVLDDSTDATSTCIRELLPELRAAGLEITHLQRPARDGFKAGALAAGMAQARGDVFLVLDADFVPGPDLLRELLPSLNDAPPGPRTDPGRHPLPGKGRIGMVQARWDHLNEKAGLLTRAQALLLDGHFHFEQGGRYAAGHFLNFNGTAGIWRREALEDAGGWSADTLTEDLDVSYRAQMAGWRFVYRGDVGVPAELPEGVRALEVQQKRWAQGGVETGRKLLGQLWRGPWGPGVKIEGTFHLLAHLAHPLTVLLGLLLLPSALARRSLGLDGWLLLDLLVFAGATGSFLLFYLAAARTRGRPWPSSCAQAVLALVVGVGLTASVSRAVLRGVSGRGRGRDPFQRTPKGGQAGLRRYRVMPTPGDLLLKGALAGWMAVSIAGALAWGFYPTLPFLLLFGAGWSWLALGALLEGRPRGRRSLPGPAGDLTAELPDPVEGPAADPACGPAAGPAPSPRPDSAPDGPDGVGLPLTGTPAGAHGPGAGDFRQVVALIPALNEEESLPGVLEALRAQGVHRILVVDNGSTDATARVAREGGAAVVHEPRRGYGQACLTGIREVAAGIDFPGAGAARGSEPGVILFLDGDQSDDPEAIPRILEPIVTRVADLVIGVRAGVADAPPHQRLGTLFVTWLARHFHGVQLSDLGPFRAVTWSGLRRLHMDDTSWGWTLQMQLRAHRLGLGVVEVPVSRRVRAAGRSKISGSLVMSVRVGMRMLMTLVQEREWRPSPPPSQPAVRTGGF